MFPAANIAPTLVNPAWPINPIPGRNFLRLNEINGSTARYPGLLVRGVLDAFRRFFECRCTPFTAVPGFGGHGWSCILNMVLITGALVWIFKVSSSAFAEGVKEGIGSDGE